MIGIPFAVVAISYLTNNADQRRERRRLLALAGQSAHKVVANLRLIAAGRELPNHSPDLREIRYLISKLKRLSLPSEVTDPRGEVAAIEDSTGSMLEFAKGLRRLREVWLPDLGSSKHRVAELGREATDSWRRLLALHDHFVPVGLQWPNEKLILT